MVSSSKKDTNLIPRKIIFGNPDKALVKVSQNGQYISYIAPLNGVLNVFVAPINHPDEAKPVTSDKGSGITTYYWAYNNKHLLYLQDNNGDENYHLYTVNMEDLTILSLTDYPETSVEIINMSHFFPDKIIIAMNRRCKEYFDIYEVDLLTGKITEFYRNNEYASRDIAIVIDDNYKLRFAKKMNPDGGLNIYEFVDKDNNVSNFMEISPEDLHTTRILDFGNEDNIYMMDSMDRNTAALVSYDLKTKQKTIIYEHEKADISDSLMLHPTKNHLQAVRCNYLRKQFKIIDKTLESAFEKMYEMVSGELEILSRTLNDNIWIFADQKDDGPTSYYLYNRAEDDIKFLFHNRDNLLNYELSKMYPIVIKARDGLELVNYLTLPSGFEFDDSSYEVVSKEKTVPLVLLVHGGPTARDVFGFNAHHQWLANRGYAVLSVNYRGSFGFGKDFLNAGNGEWSRKVHTDLVDSVNWIIDKGITEKDNVAILGGSYGGYAALCGLTFSPDVFRCAISLCGMSNLETSIKNNPPYWKPIIASYEKRSGGHLRTEEGRKELRDRSPLFFIDRIKKPLLIGHGANDPRVMKSESDQIVDLMNKKGIPVTYILYPEEGHGFDKPENRISFFAISEYFLKQHLGGLFEEYGTDLEKAKFEVLSGSI